MLYLSYLTPNEVYLTYIAWFIETGILEQMECLAKSYHDEVSPLWPYDISSCYMNIGVVPARSPTAASVVR